MQHVSRTLVLCALLGATLAPGAAEAQGGLLGRARERVKQKVEERANERTDQAADAAVNRAESAVICAVTDRPCIERAQREGRTAVDPDGNPIPGGAAQGGGQAAGARPGQGAWANYDFVPGERVIFAEDFSRDRVGDFPRRLRYVGGPMEVVESGGKRYVSASDAGRFAIPLPEKLPERFTIEFDATIPANWESMIFFSGEGMDGIEHAPTGACCYVPTPSVTWSASEIGLKRDEEQRHVAAVATSGIFPDGDVHGRLVRIRLHVDGEAVKLYADERRVANVPSLGIHRGDRIYVDLNGQEDVPVLFGNVSVNAGGRRIADALMADGRVATQGILFDTGSDRIRPESTPTLAEITATLKQHADLRLMIEGHTDNVGQPAANLALSGKRAAAVKQYLVSQGIDASRLQSKGLGDTKPKAGNDTPEGRQQNRRVELVRL